jgi:glycosyltransferase involved in cell wall biosynthesis
MLPSVLFLSAGQIGADGCGWYRMEQPCRALVAAGVAAEVSTRLPVVFGASDTATRRVVRLRTEAPALVFQRPLADFTRQAVEIAAGEGRSVWVELDDDCWSLPAHDPAARQITREMVANLTAACRAATGVIVSTPNLAHRVTRQTGQRNVVVIPNAIDPLAMPPPPLLPPGPLVVGWAGSASHSRDMALALPALRAVAALPDILVSIQGEDLLAGTGIPHRHAPWTPDVRHHYLRAALLRVAIAPLLPSAFNAAKSSIKWLESAWFSTPMVLSRVGPYARDIEHRRTGLLADGAAAFKRHLTSLANDPALRAAIGQAAREEVLAKHLIAHRVPEYMQVLGLSAAQAA